MAGMADGLPASMPAAVIQGDRTVAVERRPLPEVGPTDVLLEVSHCGICGSDIHMVLEGWGRKGSIGGHEWSGRVVAVGEAVQGWSVGDLAVGGADPGCGRCDYCVAGKPVLCTGRTAPGTGSSQGAFAGYVRAGATSLLAVPGGMDPRVAALTEPLAVAMHGLTNGGVQPGQRVLVTGAGPIGLLTIAALRARGVGDVVVSEPSEGRRELAVAVGATGAVAPDELTIPDFPMTVPDPAYDVVLECSGHDVAMEAGLAQLRPAGTLVLVGAGIERPRWDPNRILLNELHVTGAYCYDDHGCDRALELLATGDLPTDALVEPDDVPLGDVQSALERLHHGELAGKVMVTPR